MLSGLSSQQRTLNLGLERRRDDEWDGWVVDEDDGLG